MTIATTLNTGLRRVPPWVVYCALALPLLRLLYRAVTNQLGFEPVETLEHELGITGLWLLMAGLLITPLRQWTGVSLIRYRRAFGLMAFGYVALHLLVWALLDTGGWAAALRDIIKRPYITVGMIGFGLLLPLAVTSNDRAIRTMGKAWRQLHRLVYVAVPLGALHYVLLVKGFQIEPLIYLALALALVATRLPGLRRTKDRRKTA